MFSVLGNSSNSGRTTCAPLNEFFDVIVYYDSFRTLNQPSEFKESNKSFTRTALVCSYLFWCIDSWGEGISKANVPAGLPWLSEWIEAVCCYCKQKDQARHQLLGVRGPLLSRWGPRILIRQMAQHSHYNHIKYHLTVIFKETLLWSTPGI